MKARVAKTNKVIAKAEVKRVQNTSVHLLSICLAGTSS